MVKKEVFEWIKTEQKTIELRRGRASRSAEVEYLIKLGLEHENDSEEVR